MTHSRCKPSASGVAGLAVAVILLASPGFAAPGQAAPRALSDGPKGVTCANYSLAGRLGWQQKLGDWVDQDGVLHGPAPVATAKLGNKDLRAGLQLDITSLARDWLNGSRPNTGVLLRSRGGQGIVRFDSRETTSGIPPVLELEWRGRPATKHAALMDSSLDCSTFRSLGQSKNVVVGPDKNALLVFDLPEEEAAELVSATLVLAPNRFFGRSMEIAAFSTQPPWAQDTVARADGLASRYPGDSGIGDDPEVLFHSGFDEEGWLQQWQQMTRSEMAIVTTDAGNTFQPVSGPALKTTLKQGENMALNLRYLFARHHVQEPEEIYFRYYLRFGDNWSPDLDGGKLPGLAGTYGKAGWGMRKSDGSNGWSVRGAFSTQLPGAQDMPALTPIGSYVYHADMKGNSGNHWGWNLGPGGLLANNQWYAIEQYLRLNTPGRRDGQFRAWINGRLVYERDELNFRDTDVLRIESVWMNIYHGGVRPAPRDMSAYIDNVVIARQYIGPLAESSP